ncbi:DUF445 domain-containing protein [Undibacterium arcticum]
MKNIDKKQALANMRLFATSLLLLVAALYILARSRHGHHAWDWVAAFAEAAMIGALADWFAVVALFKHPLGLPIPHTAIIPRNKERIADNLAAFVRDKFLDTEVLVEKVREFNPTLKIAAWLTRGANAALLADKLVAVFVGALDFIDDLQVRQLLRSAVAQRLQQLDVGVLAGRLLDTLTEDNRHQALLDAGLRRCARLLDDPDNQKVLAGMILEVAGREYPTMLRMVGVVSNTEELSEKIAASLVAGVNRWLHDISDDPQHPRRRQFDDTVTEFIEHLKHDPAYHARIAQWKHQLLSAPLVAQYIDGLWDQLKTWLRDDLARDDSAVRRKIAAGAGQLGQWLTDNPQLRDSVNQHMADAARALVFDLRETISHHIASTVKKWEDSELVRELELSIGRDLQFIRINGTLVGGLIGLILHGLFLFL